MGGVAGPGRLGRLGLLAALVAGCELTRSPTSTLAPRSDFARDILRVYGLVFWVDLAIFLVVAGILTVVVLRFRERDPRALPAQVRGNPRLELTWTLLPALVLALIAAETVPAIFRSQAAAPPDALRVRVVGRQWWWEFEYPELGIRTATELHLPVGRPVVLELTSEDVIHAFWVPRLGGKRDAIPGRVNRLLLTPEVPGEYPGQCAEFCGESHANMRHRAVVHPPGGFEAWVARQQAPPPEPPEDSPAARGRAVFLTRPCAGCHTVQGTSGGRLGPDLTHVASRSTLAGGLLPNRPEVLRAWIQDPRGLKPGALMPAVPLGEPELEALVAYLESLR